MKIGIMIPDSVGGMQSSLVALCRALGKYGNREDYRLMFVGVDDIYLYGRTVPEFKDFYDASCVVRERFVKEHRLNVVHFPIPHYFEKLSVPTTYTVHDLMQKNLPHLLGAFLKTRVRDTDDGIAQARGVVTLCDTIKQEVLHWYGEAAKKTVVINWAPTTEFTAQPSKEQCEAVKDKFSLPLHFGFYPAMPYEHKNHLKLCEALAELHKRDHLPLSLVFTGKQDYLGQARLSMMAEYYGVKDQVRILGQVTQEDLRALYRMALFTIIPSLHEGFCLPIIEAFYDGCPVACSNLPVLREIADDGAFYFDPHSVDAIRSTFVQMLSDQGLRERLINAGSLIVKRFTWEKTVLQYRQLWERVQG